MADKPFKSSISDNQSSSDFVSKVHRTTADLERLIHNLSVDGMMDDVAADTVGAGLRGNASMIARNQSGGAIARKKEEERKRFVRAMYRAISEYERLSAEIAALDEKIAAFEDDVFTDEEKRRIGKLPKDQQEKARADLMQEKLRLGLITQDQYDQWLQWKTDREAAAAKRTQVAETLEHADEAKIERTVDKEGAEVAEAAAEEIGGQQAINVEVKSEVHVDVGNASKHSDAQSAGFAAVLSGGSTLGGGLGGTSAASLLAPDDSMTSKTPALKPVFTAKATQTEPIDPDAKSDIVISQSNGKDPLPPVVG